MYARKHVSGGYQLIKYDLNLSPMFNPNCGALVVRGEYLRNGYLFSTTEKMYAYMKKYVMHTLRHRGFVGERFNNHKEKVPTAFDKKQCRDANKKFRELFGTNF